MKYEKLVIILGVNNIVSFLLFGVLLELGVWIGFPLIFFFSMLIGIFLIIFLVLKDNKEQNRNWKPAPKKKKYYYYYGSSSSKDDSNKNDELTNNSNGLVGMDKVFYKEAVKFYDKSYSKKYSKRDLINKYMEDTKR